MAGVKFSNNRVCGGDGITSHLLPIQFSASAATTATAWLAGSGWSLPPLPSTQFDCISSWESSPLCGGQLNSRDHFDVDGDDLYLQLTVAAWRQRHRF